MAVRLIFRSVASTPAVKPLKVSYLPIEAIALAKAYAVAPFDETVEVALNLLVNPRKGDQLVRGSCYLPFGLGKQFRLAVFTSETYAEQAVAAGADLAGDELMAQVAKGEVNFDKVLATSEVIPSLKRYGKTLGPKGLMPSAKMGTVVEFFNLTDAIRKAKMGQVTFRVEESKVLHAPIGKASFPQSSLLQNYATLITEINRLRPVSLKGSYIESAFMKTTHGPAWRLSLEGVDAKTKGFSL